jgi:hypothetical protein
VYAFALNLGTNSGLQFVITSTENKYLTNREHSLWDNGEISFRGEEFRERWPELPPKQQASLSAS